MGKIRDLVTAITRGDDNPDDWYVPSGPDERKCGKTDDTEKKVGGHFRHKCGQKKDHRGRCVCEFFLCSHMRDG